MVLITGYCMLISVGWNMPSAARFYVGLTTIFFIVAVVILNIARWLVFLIKYARMNYKRYFGRMVNVQGKKVRENSKKLPKSSQKEIVVNFDTQRDLMSTNRSENGMK